MCIERVSPDSESLPVWTAVAARYSRAALTRLQARRTRTAHCIVIAPVLILTNSFLGPMPLAAAWSQFSTVLVAYTTTDYRANRETEEEERGREREREAHTAYLQGHCGRVPPLDPQALEKGHLSGAEEKLCSAELVLILCQPNKADNGLAGGAISTTLLLLTTAITVNSS